MMALGMFVFELNTLPYQQDQQKRTWRHPTNSRIGQRPASQFLGPGEETRKLAGVLYPELTGGEVELAQLAQMADQGDAYPLVTAAGDVLGLFVIEGLDVTRSVFFADGTARRLEFDLHLARYDDDQVDQVGGQAGTGSA